MGGDVKIEQQDLASLLASKSALSRRRADALCRIAANRIKVARSLVVVAAMFGIAVTIAASQFANESRQARDCAVPLTLPTAASNIDRFFILHRVRHGDTIWHLAKYYYGSNSYSNQRRLLDANPGLPKDLRLLTVDTTIKVPLI